MLDRILDRRHLLGTLGLAGLAASTRASADEAVRLPLPGVPAERALTTAFPSKGSMILQRTASALSSLSSVSIDRLSTSHGPSPLAQATKDCQATSRNTMKAPVAMRMDAAMVRRVARGTWWATLAPIVLPTARPIERSTLK